MASTNQSPFYKKAEARFLLAKTNEEKLEALEEMIRECPKHKSSENMLANLKTRRKKLLQQLERSKKSRKSKSKGIKKDDMQAIIIGYTNSGKSSLLKTLTNAEPEIASYKFTTKMPLVGMMNYSGIQIQLIENPAIESEYYDKGLTNTADTILIIINNLEQIKKIEDTIKNATGKKIIVFNCKENLRDEEKRKITATLSSKKHNFQLISTETSEGIAELKEKIFYSFDKIRIYMKEPGKEKSEKPVIMNPESKVYDVAERILKGFSSKIAETKIWGPSSKFAGQKIGLQHKLKDKDILEFKTK